MTLNDQLSGESDQVVRHRSRSILPNGRVAVGAGLIALAAVVGFAGATRSTQGPAPIPVIVAKHDITPGHLLNAEDLSTSMSEGRPGFTHFSDPADLIGRIALAPMQTGELISPSQVTDGQAETGFEVWVELPAVQAAGAHLRPGDKVDVFTTDSNRTVLISAAAKVLSSASGEDSLGVGTAVTVSLSVTGFDDVVAIVHAQSAGNITLVKSTAAADHTAQAGTTYDLDNGTSLVTTDQTTSPEPATESQSTQPGGDSFVSESNSQTETETGHG